MAPGSFGKMVLRFMVRDEATKSLKAAQQQLEALQKKQEKLEAATKRTAAAQAKWENNQAIKKVKKDIDAMEASQRKAEAGANRFFTKGRALFAAFGIGAALAIGGIVSSFVNLDKVMAEITIGMSGMTASVKRELDAQARYIQTNTTVGLAFMSAYGAGLKDMGLGGDYMAAAGKAAANYGMVTGAGGGQVSAMEQTATRALGFSMSDPKQRASQMSHTYDLIAAGREKGGASGRTATRLKQALETGDIYKAKIAYDELNASLTDVDGTVDRLANDRMKTASGQFAAVKGNVLVLAQTLGQVLVPVILVLAKTLTFLADLLINNPWVRYTALIVGATWAIGALTAAQNAGTLAVIWNTVSRGANTIATTIGTGALALMGLVVGKATVAQWGLNAAMTANPIGLIIVGVAALIAAVVVLIKYWDNITNFFHDNPWMYALMPIVGIFELIIWLIQKIWGLIKEVGKALKNAFGWIGDTLGAVGDFFGGAISGIGNFLGFDTGGEVTHTGVAKVHKGETIIPAAKGNKPYDANTPGAGGGGATFVFQGPIYMRDEAEAKSTARVFAQEFLAGLSQGG